MKRGWIVNNYHTPVLLKEVIEYLGVKEDGKYIDGTIGGGGHTIEILKRGGRVLGIDADQDAIEYVQGKFKIGKGLILVRGNFRNIDQIAHLNNFENIDGILLDLGVSSHQIDTAARGFSFSKAGPLDMRMDQDLAVRAADLINVLTKGELYELFSKLGETNRALAISDGIVRARGVKPITETQELVSIIGEAHGFRGKAISDKIKAEIAAKVFQALRIAVNDELNSLRETLPKAVKLLKSEGRLVVISFHS
ncbi:MAG: 16S rRNA (cytosine(1402)-N(4))-methyltransferase RsmH, partial [Patescibacteria group bacterium]|nr:16S rRNA (cytosine(1402)-N(4))-methyltransferase RsmH [Patescibacteria group bacterium]